VLCKLNQFLQAQFVSPESPLNLNKTFEEKKKLNQLRLEQQKRESAKNSMKLPGMGENESDKSKSESEKRKEELKKSLAERLITPPLVR